MLHLFKKTLAVCLIGFGIGVLMVILLPFGGWLFIIRGCNSSSWHNLVMLLNKGVCLYDRCCKKSP